ncbi:MAG: glycosyltransferase family 2 protein [Bacteroidales bacterium]
MNTPTTAVVILNWNGRHLLERFLPDVIRFTPPEVEIVVADNASKDDSVAFLASYYPGIRVVKLLENHGYAGGYNRALKRVKADFYVLLNSDIAVTENWLSPCIQMLQERKEVVACQPKIRSLENPDYFEYAGASGGFLDFLGYPFCRGRIFDEVESDHGQYDGEIRVFWASGAALFVKSGAFWEAGGFDERFFAHMEEIDLCWRLQHKGYQIMVCPASTVYHLGGASLPASSPGKTFLNFRNSLWMLAKNLPARKFYLWILIRLALDEIAATRFLMQGRFGSWLAVIRAQFAFLVKLPGLRLRSHVSKSLPAALYRRSIVADYYFRGKKRFSDLFFTASNARR